MTEWTVTWDVDVEADGPVEAAAAAWAMIREADSTASVFHVERAPADGGPRQRVDLAEQVCMYCDCTISLDDVRWVRPDDVSARCIDALGHLPAEPR
jgi:hypothetical protein